MKKIGLKDKIDEFIYNQINSEIEVVNTIPTLTYNRFDLVFKLFFLENIKNNKSKDYNNIYDEHIRSLSLGSFVEPGQESTKNSIEAFRDIFKSIYADISLNGFDGEKSVVPLTSDGSIFNGSHRTAISIFLNREMNAVKTDLPPPNYNYKFFYNRNIPISMLDKVATKFIEYSSNTYIAFVWPTAKNYDMELDTLFPNIVFRKQIKLNENGAHNLLSQIYKGESWLGTIENNFYGVISKLVECFNTFDPIRIVVFQEESLDNVIKIKEKVRTVFGKGKHSIHITDTHEESIRLSQLIFNDNGVHFLNYARPNHFLNFHKKITKFKLFLEKNNANNSDYVLASSIVLEAYGIRKAEDTDYLSVSCKEIVVQCEGINAHDEDLEYHTAQKKDLVYNSDNFFYFEDLKFISFSKLYDFKKLRLESKDLNDCAMMEAMLKDNRLKKQVASFKQFLLYKRVFIKNKALIFMKKANIYEPMRFIYKLFKK
jgi:hypothetical protein